MENGTKVFHHTYGDGEVLAHMTASKVRVAFVDYGVSKVVDRGTLDVISARHISQSNTRVENRAIDLYWSLAEKDSLDESERLLLAAINQFLG